MIPASTNGATSQGVCLTAMARPSRMGPRHAAGPRVCPNRSQRTAAPASSGMNRKSVTPPTAYPAYMSMLTITATSGPSRRGSTANRITAPMAQAAMSTQMAACVLRPAASSGI
jgi:hypothetical protein